MTIHPVNENKVTYFSQVFGVCCPDPGSQPTNTPAAPPPVEDEQKDDDEDYPVEAQVINKDCGSRYPYIVNGQVTRKHEYPFMVRKINCGAQAAVKTNPFQSSFRLHF
jgi:hypothetical protein